MSPSIPRKVAIITGASQGIGEGLVAGFRRSGYAVVGTSLLKEALAAEGMTLHP